MNLDKTTYKIIDSPAGKTIIFTNLYFINGCFIFDGNVSHSEISTYINVGYRHTKFEKWAPQVFNLNSEYEIQNIVTPNFFYKESLCYHPTHTLMDDIFSVFYSLYRCNIDYYGVQCIVDSSCETGNDYDNKEYFNVLFGKKATTLAYLKATNKNFCFQTFVVGNGNSGFSSYDYNFVSPHENNIWKQFRDAFYKRAGVNLESGNKVIYVNFIGNQDTADNLKNKLIENNIQIINWAGGSITEQLNVLKDVAIYITMEGAAACNCIFLPDGAVMIDLGRVYANNKYKAISYVMDYLLPAISYIDVFYFEDYFRLIINEMQPAPNVNDLMDMVKTLLNKRDTNILTTKRAKIKSDFALKVLNEIPNSIKLDNFSPNARLLLKRYPNVAERSAIIETFKRENLAFACGEKIREL